MEKKETYFFNKTNYNNEEFQKIIRNNYYIIHLNLKANCNKNYNDEIKSYKQFIQSACQFIVFIVDSCFVEIYAKNQSILKQIIVNAKNNDFQNITYIKDSIEAYKSFSKYCQLFGN